MLKKNILLKKNSFEDDINYVRGFYIKNRFYIFIKMLDEFKEKLPPKYTKIYLKKYIFPCLNWPPCNMFSPCSQDLSLVHLCC